MTLKLAKFQSQRGWPSKGTTSVAERGEVWGVCAPHQQGWANLFFFFFSPLGRRNLLSLPESGTSLLSVITDSPIRNPNLPLVPYLVFMRTKEHICRLVRANPLEKRRIGFSQFSSQRNRTRIFLLLEKLENCQAGFTARSKPNFKSKSRGITCFALLWGHVANETNVNTQKCDLFVVWNRNRQGGGDTRLFNNMGRYLRS